MYYNTDKDAVYIAWWVNMNRTGANPYKYENPSGTFNDYDGRIRIGYFSTKNDGNFGTFKHIFE